MKHLINPNKYLPWVIWSMAGLFYLYEFCHRIIPTLLITQLIQHFNSSHEKISELSSAYYYAYALFQIPAGILLDCYGIHKILSLAALITALGSYLFAHSNAFGLAFMGRLLIGFGSSFSFIACLKLASIWFPKRYFNFIVGLTNMLGVLGALLGSAPIAYWIQYTSWRFVLNNIALIGFGIAVLIWLIVRDAPKSKEQISDFNKFQYTLFQLITSAYVWQIAIIAGIMVLPISVYNELWCIPFISQYYHISTFKAALITSMTFVGIGIGGPTIGWLSDRCFNKIYILLLGNISALIIFIFITCLLFQNTILLGIAHIALGISCSSMIICFSLTKQNIPLQQHATVIAITNTVIMLTSAIFQNVSGKLINLLSGFEYHLAFVPVFLCLFISIILIIKIRQKNKCLVH